MPIIFLKRFLNMSSVRQLPRAAARVMRDHDVKPSVSEIVDDNNEEATKNGFDTDGKIIFDSDRQRTADPRVPLEKKKPKRTVEDVINATRRMRANYFQKTSPSSRNFENDAVDKKQQPAIEEDSFYGIPVVVPQSSTSSPSVKVEQIGSQYFDNLTEQVVEKTSSKPEELVKSFEVELPRQRSIPEKLEPPVKKNKNHEAKMMKKSVPKDNDDDDDEEKEPVAFDLAMKIRRQLEGRENAAQDSKGFRTMVGSTGPDWEAMTRAEMFNHFRKSIVYNADDIVAINKPYGLACQGGPGTRVSVASNFRLLGEWLGKLRNQGDEKGLEKSQEDEIWCRLAHRLDRDTTGVLLMVTNKTVAAKLRYWFNERKVAKTYWAVTKFVPKESEGIIDIPMYECEIAKGVYRMNLIPASEASSKKDATKAVTHYKVLDANSSSCALLELNPETGVKHQLRCHLGLGLATPVLGDHKYSNSDSMKPQRLPPAMLQALGMRQAKARSVPLHLHAARIVLPEFVDGRTIVISARPPGFFIDTARRLKLKLPNF